MSVDTVLVNGSVGVGKTSVAEQLGALLEQRGVAGAIIDLDALRRAWPRRRRPRTDAARRPDRRR